MNCRNCKADCAEKGASHEKKSCLGYVPMTNADRIRAMSDEELAKWLFCPGLKRDMFPNIPYYIAPDYKDWLDWLKEDAKGDTDEDKT